MSCEKCGELDEGENINSMSFGNIVMALCLDCHREIVLILDTYEPTVEMDVLEKQIKLLQRSGDPAWLEALETKTRQFNKLDAEFNKFVVRWLRERAD